MNLEKMFQTQKVLRDRIGYNESDRFNKLILALLTELGECANESRSFKFWSKNQQPRTKAVRVPTMMEEDKDYFNPLLEEYVDILHFVLELGIELGFTEFEIWTWKEETITDQFILLHGDAFKLYQVKVKARESVSEILFESFFATFLGLGEMLGFAWSQIEETYYQKNKINHQRQAQGY